VPSNGSAKGFCTENYIRGLQVFLQSIMKWRFLVYAWKNWLWKVCWHRGISLIQWSYSEMMTGKLLFQN